MDDSSRARSRKKRYPWLLLALAALPVLGIAALVLFITFDTAGAANFTDDVLRPLLGDARVGAVEKIFFNASDAVNQFTYRLKTPTAPFVAGDAVPLLPNDPTVRLSRLDLRQATTSASQLLGGEGAWHNIPLSAFPHQIVMADAFLRPDPARPYAFAVVVQMDMAVLRLSSVAGAGERSVGTQQPGTGMVPKNVQEGGSLIAAFEGGFLPRDGHYGMVVGTTTYMPLRKGLATIIGYKDGHVEIVRYAGQHWGNDVSFMRQNGPMLIEHGNVDTLNGTSTRKLWGAANTGDMYTWRSGIGVTQNGDLVYAAGNALVPSALAYALQAAGAVDAMQLDVNPSWVRFSVFNNFKHGAYASTTPLMGGMPNGAYSFLHGYKRDFFYVTEK